MAFGLGPPGRPVPEETLSVDFLEQVGIMEAEAPTDWVGATLPRHNLIVVNIYKHAFTFLAPPGIEPGTFRSLLGHSTTAPPPPLILGSKLTIPINCTHKMTDTLLNSNSTGKNEHKSLKYRKFPYRYIYKTTFHTATKYS